MPLFITSFSSERLPGVRNFPRRLARSFKNGQIKFAQVLNHAIEAKWKWNKRITVSIEGFAEVMEEWLEFSRGDKPQEPRVMFLQLKRVRGRGRDVQKISRRQADKAVTGKHLHFAVEAMKQLCNPFMPVTRNGLPDWSFS